METVTRQITNSSSIGNVLDRNTDFLEVAETKIIKCCTTSARRSGSIITHGTQRKKRTFPRLQNFVPAFVGVDPLGDGGGAFVDVFRVELGFAGAAVQDESEEELICVWDIPLVGKSVSGDNTADVDGLDDGEVSISRCIGCSLGWSIESIDSTSEICFATSDRSDNSLISIASSVLFEHLSKSMSKSISASSSESLTEINEPACLLSRPSYVSTEWKPRFIVSLSFECLRKEPTP